MKYICKNCKFENNINSKDEKIINEQKKIILENQKIIDLQNKKISEKPSNKIMEFGEYRKLNFTDEQHINILNSNDPIIKYIETIHFNPKKPEFQNIRIDKNKILIYKQSKWIPKNKTEVVNDLFDYNIEIVHSYSERYSNEITLNALNNINILVSNHHKYNKLYKELNQYSESDSDLDSDIDNSNLNHSNEIKMDLQYKKKEFKILKDKKEIIIDKINHFIQNSTVS